jgi:tartrate-resistant acid phosphatase type 5
MPDYYSEPFITLAGLTHKSALVSWGAFYFRVKDSGEEFKLVDDDDLKNVHPPRNDSIGATSKSYGPARVQLFDAGGNPLASFTAPPGKNHCWVTDLKPDTEYAYKVFVKSGAQEEEWAGGPRRNWERVGGEMGLGPKNKAYRNRFRTFPDPTAPAPRPFTFAVIGDFGVGVRKEDDRGQRQIAEALEKAVDQHDVRFLLTTGDNIYRRGGLFGIFGGETGDEDDDWYFTYYQPYRYVINRVPVYPSIGNHDADETEEKDDRTQLFDNFYVEERVAGEEAAGRASVNPGLFYRFRFGADAEFICIDTSKEPSLFPKRLFEFPKHKEFLDKALPAANGGAAAGPAWRIPFCHHPPYSAGPTHADTGGMGDLVKQFERAGVRLVLSGHEHNFQESRRNGVKYIVTGGAGKLRTDEPEKATQAERISWAAQYHFLLVTIDGRRATIQAVGALQGGNLAPIRRNAVGGGEVVGEIVVELP